MAHPPPSPTGRAATAPSGATPEDRPAIEVRDLVKVFRTVRAIDGVSFSVPRGQACALLGPNGAGKTTTIQSLLGLTLPTEGTIEVNGIDVVRHRSDAIRGTNFMASYVSFPWRMRIREVLRVYAELYEVADPRPAIEEAIELFGLGSLLDRPVQALSSGQQTLAGLAKALINRPSVLFLDEPTASLDPEHAYEVRQILRSVADERGMTILITSHNMTEIERIADRILFLAKGRLIADAPPQELRQRFSASDLEEVFLQVARGAREDR